MNVKNKAALIFAIGLALISAFFILNHVNGIEKNISSRYDTKPVVVAIKDIPIHSVVTRNSVTIKKIPKYLLVSGQLKELSDAVGKITLVPILSGEQVSSIKLTSKAKSNKHFLDIPEGKRALVITPDDATGTTGLIKPGDRVDIILTSQQTGSSESQTTVIEDVNVARTSKDWDMEAEAADAVGSIDVPLSVTVIVTQKQAEQIALADEYGRVKLALRPIQSASSDQKIKESETPSAITIASLREERPLKAATVPKSAVKTTLKLEKKAAPPPYTTKPKMIEVIRGTDSSSVVFAH